jgi:D-serine ammonia-lyase
LYGFYCHQGTSYRSTSLDEASSFLWKELDAADGAARQALDLLKDHPNASAYTEPFVLSVGSTPTAHAAATAQHLSSKLNGVLEIHAGNYPLLDLQQVNTSLIETERVAQRVLATVVSYYPGRGEDGSDEALVDAGAIAMSKDTGPIAGFGAVIGKRWKLGRVSQEHGTLVRDFSVPCGQNKVEDEIKIGEQVEIIGQHACLICAAYPWSVTYLCVV